jgi:hypothetical protein
VVTLAIAHEQLRRLIGASGPASTGTISIRDIERFVTASGDELPTSNRADGRLPAPPLMVSSTIEWGAGPRLGDLRTDGTGVGREAWLPLEGLRLMGGGQDLTFHAVVLSGEAITATPRLEDVELKRGSSGELLLLTITTVFADDAGNALVTCRETLIAR